MSPHLRWPGRRKLQRQEITWLLVGLGACVLVLLFVLLAGEVTEGGTQALDERTLRALRTANDPSVPVGPAWLEFAFLDLTALGGGTLLTLIVAAVTGFLCLQALPHGARHRVDDDQRQRRHRDEALFHAPATHRGAPPA
jgi:hypothetical protein